jgi:hypothetical protein
MSSLWLDNLTQPRVSEHLVSDSYWRKLEVSSVDDCVYDFATSETIQINVLAETNTLNDFITANGFF